MAVLRAYLSVSDFDSWKENFDSDPMDRKGSGVIRYWVHRPIDEPTIVLVDLELGSVEQAKALLARLEEFWASGRAPIVGTPRTQIAETVDVVELGG
ncbi:hypothetical protein [Salinibacterium sp. ZJ450]|uniref:hypothetical protein n=1 Tax=Salinibacterium sp. ZJ450 TaxID=2708338 RepID=UPI0014212647|nr:hypothetical protein [Salinibacterium sp. ZJ450]